MISFKSLAVEAFDKASDFLSDPKNDETGIEEILEKFKAEGGKVEYGKQAWVLIHPKWNYVAKIFSNDVPYLKFIRFTLKNPRPSFPKLFGKPRRIIPRFKRGRTQEKLYVVLLEKLEPITKKEWENIKFFLYYGNNPEYAQEMSIRSSTWVGIANQLKVVEQTYPSLTQFKKDHDFLMNSPHDFGTNDVIERNVMKRPNGEFVLSDPFWEGETPYQTHDRLQRSEMDYYGDEHSEPEPQISGGKRYKKPKVKDPPKSPPKSSGSDDVPFE
jgi:hypothetical protein